MFIKSSAYTVNHNVSGDCCLASHFVTVVGILTLGSFPNSVPRQGPVRPALSMWTVFSLLIVTAYSSSLISHLTSRVHSKEVTSVREMVERGFTWGNTYTPDGNSLFDEEVNAKLMFIFMIN